MARQLIAAQTTPGAYPTLPVAANSRDLAMTAADAANFQYTPIVENKTMVIVQNTGVGARTVTFTSAPDPTFGRSGDITAYSLGAGELGLFGPFKGAGWGNVGPDVTLATSLAADDIIDTSAPHLFALNDKVRFTALTGGAGLAIDTDYYVVAASLGSTTFRVSAQRGGTPINFTTDITAGTVVKVSDNLWFEGSHAEVKFAVITLP